MEPFVRLTGLVAPLPLADVDTDQIVPKQFLKRIGRSGFGEVLFFDWRYLPNGQPNPDFVLNAPRYHGATILATGRNFGCGSSREHAPWALRDYGFRAVVAPSFADIFRNNCLRNGLLPVALPEDLVETILRRAGDNDAYRLTVDLEKQQVWDDLGLRASFDIEHFWKNCLLEGLDEIALTLRHEDAIAAYENTRPAWLPKVT